MLLYRYFLGRCSRPGYDVGNVVSVGRQVLSVQSIAILFQEFSKATCFRCREHRSKLLAFELNLVLEEFSPPRSI